jgi:hypothetical protein
MTVNPEECGQGGGFITIESDKLTEGGLSGQRKFLMGLADWNPSFTTFTYHPNEPALLCGCNDAIYSVNVLSGEFKHFRMSGFFRQFAYSSPSSLIVDAEAGIYSLTWDLDQLWHASTDLIQSIAINGSQILLETDSGDVRLDLGTGKVLQ